MNNKKSILAGLIGLALLAGCSQGPDQTDKHSGLALANMDTRVKPGDDCFRYVNGHWLGTAKIPDDRPADGAFYMLRDKSLADVRVLVEGLDGKAAAGTQAQQIRDLYQSYLDSEDPQRQGHCAAVAHAERDRADPNPSGPRPRLRPERPHRWQRPVRLLDRRGRQGTGQLCGLPLSIRTQPAGQGLLSQDGCRQPGAAAKIRAAHRRHAEPLRRGGCGGQGQAHPGSRDPARPRSSGTTWPCGTGRRTTTRGR